MSGYLGKFFKQSTETLDYAVDYTDWMFGRSDSPVSFSVSADPGITVVGSSRSGPVVTVMVAGGVSGGKYKLTVRLTTTSGAVREADFLITVKDI